MLYRNHSSALEFKDIGFRVSLAPGSKKRFRALGGGVCRGFREHVGFIVREG